MFDSHMLTDVLKTIGFIAFIPVSYFFRTFSASHSEIFVAFYFQLAYSFIHLLLESDKRRCVVLFRRPVTAFEVTATT